MTDQLIQDVAWRAQIEARVHEVEDDLKSVSDQDPAPKASWAEVAPYAAADASLKRAHRIATTVTKPLSWSWLRRWASGSDVETAWGALHHAEAELIIVLPAATIRARLPDIRSWLTATLAGDGRLTEYTSVLEEIETTQPAGITSDQRERIRVIKSAIDATSDAAHSNIRNYRNWLLIVSTVVIVGLIGAAIAHSRDSEFIYVAEGHGGVGNGADVAQIEAAGAVGGLLMALFALIRLTVYSGPVALPLWQALVRVPAGAAAGLVGAVLLQGRVISSIIPQSRSGLLGYAVLFGAAPEILLRFLDTKVNAATAAARPKNDPLKGQGAPASQEKGAPPVTG